MEGTGREQEKTGEYFLLMKKAVERAGKFLLDERPNIKVTGGDSDSGTLQTGADLASEDIIVQEIGSHYPGGDISNGASLIAEEKGYKKARGDETSIWIIDPLDGTINYSAGRENWGVMIAYFEANQLQMGTINLPAIDVSISSLKGQGVSINGEKVMCPEGKKMEESVVAFDSYGVQKIKEATHDRKNYENLVGDVQESNCSAEVFLKLLKGKIQVFLEYKSTPWDDAAGAMLVRELGGIVTDFEGNEWTPYLDESESGYIRSRDGRAYSPKSKNLIATFDREAHAKFIEMFRKKITQHRGLREGGLGVPNSFEAILDNYRGSVEVDAVILADGAVGILHGLDFKKSLTDLEAMDVNVLQTLDLPVLGSEKSGRKVPLLREFAGLASDAGTAISLELKSSSVEKVISLAQAIVRELIDMKKENGFKGNENFLEDGMVFESYCVSALTSLKDAGNREGLRLNTTLYWPTDKSWAQKIALFEVSMLNNIDDADGLTWQELGIEVAFTYGLGGIEFQPEEITQELVDYAYERGIDINCGLVADQDEIDRLFTMGVDHILTE